MRLFILASFMAAFAVQAGAKIAVVELERAMNEVHDGQAAKAKLEAEFKEKQELLNKKQAEFEKKRVELEKAGEAFKNQAPMMKDEARQTKAIELQTKEMALRSQYAEAQQLSAAMQQDMVKKQQEVMGGILKKMNPIVQKIATEEGYVAVLNKTEMTVLYADPDLDLTGKVIQRYNAANPAALPASDKKKKK